MVFMPPALSFAKNQGLTNPLYYVASFTDLTHTNRFNYYVPFYPMALGWLSRMKPDIRTIFFICSLFSVTGLLLYARALASFLSGELSNWAKAAVVLSFSYLATYLLPTVGRPENFSGLFVFLVYLLYQRRKALNPVLYYAAIIVLISVLFSTQIIGFFFCFLFYALYEVLNAENIYKTIGSLVLLLGSVVGGFCTILMLSPHGLSETVNAIGWHIALALNRADHNISTLVYYWVYAPLSFGFVVIFLLATLFFAIDLRAKLTGAGAMKIISAVLALLLIAFGLVKYVLNAAPTVYNATQFILPLMAYIFYNILNRDRLLPARMETTALLITCLAGSLIFFRGFILFRDMMRTGKDFASARAFVSSYTKNNKKILTSNGIWPIFEDINNPKVGITDQFEHGDTIVLQQAYFPFPKSITDKCTMLYDWRGPEPVKLFGIKIANHPYGYGFVIFKAN